MITKIYKIRKQRKMTQETLASLVGLTQGLRLFRKSKGTNNTDAGTKAG